MTRVVEQGGWYGDNTLQGDSVSLHRDSHININGQRIELPVGPFGPENILQLVVKRFGNQVLIAGQGQVGEEGSGNWLYIDGKWNLLTNSFGTFACAFDPNRPYLYLVVGPNQYQFYDLTTRELSGVIPRSLGAQGIRYIDFIQSPIDGIVTSDETYGPYPYNLAQWTHLEEITVGQGYNGGCIIIYNGERRILEPGNCQFIRLHKLLDKFCLAIVKMDEVETVFYQLSLDEIKNFPLETVPTPEPIPPTPVPPILTPIPPAPEPVFKPVKEFKLMDPETVSIIGPGNLFLRLVNGKPVFDATTESSETDWEVSKPDNLFAIKKNNLYLGADTLNPPSANVGDQLYTVDHRQEYESWSIGVWPSGKIVGIIDYWFKPLVSTSITIKRHV